MEKLEQVLDRRIVSCIGITICAGNVEHTIKGAALADFAGLKHLLQQHNPISGLQEKLLTLLSAKAISVDDLNFLSSVLRQNTLVNLGALSNSDTVESKKLQSMCPVLWSNVFSHQDFSKPCKIERADIGIEHVEAIKKWSSAIEGMSSKNLDDMVIEHRANCTKLIQRTVDNGLEEKVDMSTVTPSGRWKSVVDLFNDIEEHAQLKPYFEISQSFKSETMKECCATKMVVQFCRYGEQGLRTLMNLGPAQETQVRGILQKDDRFKHLLGTSKKRKAP